LTQLKNKVHSTIDPQGAAAAKAEAQAKAAQAHAKAQTDQAFEAAFEQHIGPGSGFENKSPEEQLKMLNSLGQHVQHILGSNPNLSEADKQELIHTKLIPGFDNVLNANSKPNHDLNDTKSILQHAPVIFDLACHPNRHPIHDFPLTPPEALQARLQRMSTECGPNNLQGQAFVHEMIRARIELELPPDHPAAGQVINTVGSSAERLTQQHGHAFNEQTRAIREHLIQNLVAMSASVASMVQAVLDDDGEDAAAPPAPEHQRPARPLPTPPQQQPRPARPLPTPPSQFQSPAGHSTQAPSGPRPFPKPAVPPRPASPTPSLQQETQKPREEHRVV
jgi:hypothetical protein